MGLNIPVYFSSDTLRVSRLTLSDQVLPHMVHSEDLRAVDMAAIGVVPRLDARGFPEDVCRLYLRHCPQRAGSGLAALHRHTYIFAKSRTCALIATSVGRRSIELAP